MKCEKIDKLLLGKQKNSTMLDVFLKYSVGEYEHDETNQVIYCREIAIPEFAEENDFEFGDYSEYSWKTFVGNGEYSVVVCVDFFGIRYCGDYGYSFRAQKN